MAEHSEIKSENLAKKYKNYHLNDGECYYLVDEAFVASNCIWLYGRKRCEKYIWGT